MLFEVSFVQHTCNSGEVSVTLTSQHGVDLNRHPNYILAAYMASGT